MVNIYEDFMFINYYSLNVFKIKFYNRIKSIKITINQNVLI